MTGGRDWSYKLNKRERRLGLATALSQKLAEGNLAVVDEASCSTLRTAPLSARLEARGWSDALFVVGTSAEGGDDGGEELGAGAAAAAPPISDKAGFGLFCVAAKNLPSVHVLPSIGANVYDLLRREKVVVTLGAVEQLTARLTAPVRRNYWEVRFFTRRLSLR